MNERGFGTLAIILVLVGLFALGSGIYYYEAHQSNSIGIIQPPLNQSTRSQTESTTQLAQSPTVQSAISTTPATSQTLPPSTSIKLLGASTLHAIADLHRQDVPRSISDPQLFEVQTSLTASQISAGDTFLQSAYTNFFSPQDNVNYVAVEEWFSTSTAKRNFSVTSLGFVANNQCGGGAVPAGVDCNSPTGKPENPSEHLPIQGWNIDVGDIIRILNANNYKSSGSSDVTVTTVGRAKNQNYRFWPQGQSSLNSYPDGLSIILIVGTNSWMALNAEDGAVLASGTYNPLPQWPV